MVKKFDQFTNEGLRDKMTGKSEEEVSKFLDKYDEKKERIKELLEELLKEYDDFTKMISSKHWRTSGDHYYHIKKLLEEIDSYEKTTVDKFIKALPYM